MSNTKIKKNYIYNGLGFPIVLAKAEFHKVRNRWLLKIDVEKLSDLVIRLLPEKPTGLTGDEIRFMRTYLGFSKRKLADLLRVSHTAVNKWETCDDKKARIEPLTEVALRSFIKLQLNEDNNFSSFYRAVMDDAKNFSQDSQGPLKIAI